MSSAHLCPKGHPLQERAAPAPFQCDVCDAASAAAEISLHCAPCDFDQCVGCTVKQLPLVCPKTHPLKRHVTTTGQFSCDRCEEKISKNAATAACRPCDFDICASCVFADARRLGTKPNAARAAKCPQGHVMVGRTEKARFRCDVCSGISSNNELSMACAQCDYDQCVGCTAGFGDLKCNADHGLQKTVIVREGFTCDKCSKPVPVGRSVASCRDCDYDVCAACVFSEVLDSVPRELKTIADMWSEVQRFESKRLPKSALAVVKDIIIPAARVANDHAQLLKATLFLAKGTIETEDVGMDVGMQLLEKELKQPTFVTSPAEIAFLHGMMGDMYSRYLDLVRHSISSRTDPGEEAPLPEDIKVWAPAQLERVAFDHYVRSVAAPEALAKEKTSDYNVLLTSAHDPKSLEGRIRPTLLDFVGHRALSYFSNENSFLTEPSNRFVLRDKDAFGDAKTFVGIAFTSTDSTSRRFRALQVYQAMLRVKLAAVDTAAAGEERRNAIFSLVELELLRARFVRNSLKGLSDGEVTAMYGAALLRLLGVSKESAAAAGSVLVALGAHYQTLPVVRPLPANGDSPPEDAGPARLDLPTAMMYYREVIKQCSREENSVAVSQAEAAIFNIERTELSATAENFVAPGASFIVSTNSKNIDDITYRIVKLTEKEKEEYNELRGTNTDRKAFLLARPAVGKDKVVALERPVGDYYSRSVEFVADPLTAPGHYSVCMWPSKNRPEEAEHFVVVPFHVSRIAVVKTNIDNKESHVTVDRVTGEPLKGVKATVYSYEWSGSKRTRKVRGTGKSDANGFIDMPSIGYDNYCNVYYELNDDRLDAGDSYSENRRYASDTENVYTYFFLDRNIYRPGQTIYFKGLHIKSDKKDVPSILTGKKLTITLRDANYQEKEKVTVTTNEYGSFEGTFTAPTTGLTGRMTLQEADGSASFRVEEYKRPRFEVTMTTPAQNVRVGEKAKVEGTAINFSGIPLGGAVVKYRVRRVARAPWFWGFWCRVPQWAGRSAEILSDSVTADEKGKFTIEFTAVPDSDLPAEDKPEFDYVVSADVTDITGETQSGSTTMKVGYIALRVDVPLSDTMTLESLRALPVGLTDLNDNPIAATASITLEPLVTPYPLGCPFVSRQWSVPDRIAMDKASFKKVLPQFAYSDEDTPAKWGKKGDKYERSVSSDGTNRTRAIDLDRTNLAANTYYRVTVSARDSFGNDITVARVVQVFDSASPTSVSIASASTPSLVFAQSTYRVGDLAVVRYGKRLRFDGRPQSVLVALSTVSQVGTPEWDLTDTKGNAEVMVQQRAVSIRESDRGYVSAACIFVAYGRVFSSSASASIPWVEKELSFEYVSFRNKLEPGQQEEWRIKVKNSDPRSAGHVVAAEVVASLYDSSLDSLTGNSAHSFANSVRYLWPEKRPDLSLSSGCGYHCAGSTNLSSTNRYISSSSAWFPQLNWFNFPFRSERPAPPMMYEMCSTMCCDAAPMMMKCFAAPCPPPAPCAASACPPPPGAGGIGGNLQNQKESKKVAKRGLCDVAEDGAADDNDNADAAPPAAPAVRTNLKETVFFMPSLRTEADGTVVLRFTMGEALTRWRLLAFAHTTDLKSGTHNDGSIITQKEVMVTPNPPRFLREGDTINFAAKVSNMGDTPKDGAATLELLDGVTGAPLNEAYGLPSKAEVPFSCGAAGQSAAVSWNMKVPFGGVSVVTWRIVARSGRVGDGEESTLPVVTNRMLVTETLPMSVRGGQDKVFTLKSMANSTSTTLAHEAYTVEFTSNPAWYAVTALPYMMEFPHECSEQLFTRYYSNSLATHITQQQPQIQRVFEAWRALGSDALKSNLNRNEELKSALLEETPWVLESQSEERQKKDIALLFDLNRMSAEQTSALDKLRNRQQGDGGFAWFPGGRSSPFVTQHIAMGFAHLAHLGVKGIDANIQIKAQAFCHSMLVEEYDRLLRRVREGTAKLEDRHISHSHLLFLYTESFAKVHTQFRQQTSRPEVIAFYKSQAAKYWTDFNLYGQALIALITHRETPGGAVSTDIIKSLRERALYSEEMGRYFKYDSGYFYYEAPIETQSLMVEVFKEVAADGAFVDELRLWLLKNKQTKHWKTTKQTSEAVYALLLGGESWLEPTALVTVNVGGKPLPVVNPEPGTGYVKHRYPKAEVSSAMATIAVKNPNKVVAWGAAYWQYFESLDKIQWFEETPLKIKKDVFAVQITERGEQLRALTENEGLSVGDKVRVRIEIRVDREMSYMHLKDMRASGLEPVKVMSRYAWQDGLGYYESTKDLATHFFMDHLPKGTFVFEYDLVASQRGDFSNGITTMQCMYAPEFSSHSQGIRLTIK